MADAPPAPPCCRCGPVCGEQLAETGPCAERGCNVCLDGCPAPPQGACCTTPRRYAQWINYQPEVSHV